MNAPVIIVQSVKRGLPLGISNREPQSDVRRTKGQKPFTLKCATLPERWAIVIDSDANDETEEKGGHGGKLEPYFFKRESSSLIYSKVCRSMFSEKSMAMTAENKSRFANLRVKSPLPQLTSSRTPPKVGLKYSLAIMTCTRVQARIHCNYPATTKPEKPNQLMF